MLENLLMKRSLIKSSKIFLALMVTLYSVYFIKTITGINVSNRYSAAGIFKAPIRPLWAHKAELCAEFQTLCTLRSKIKNKVQHRVDQVKREV
jgi:hypothetical protein